MKKIALILLLAVVTVANTAAQDLSNAQLKFRLDLMRFLTDEGFEPTVDEDGDIRFERGGVPYYLLINENWEDPFLVSLYLQYGYDEENGYTKEALLNSFNVMAQYKVVQVDMYDNVYSYRSDVFCESAEVVKSTFYSLLKEMDAACAAISNIIDSGLGGVDVVNDPDVVYDKADEFYRSGDYDKSFLLFRYLSESGYTKAYGDMGLAYEFGRGVSRNERMMTEYYQKAIENGCYWCAYRLGMRQYASKEYEKALENFLICGASENGWQSEALYQAGKMYHEGEGVARNMQQAVTCYRKSVECSYDLDCDARLALIDLGIEVEDEKDFVKASKSMVVGMSPKEMYDKGYDYEYGLGGNKVSLPKAFAYYLAAAEEDYTPAKQKMGEIYVSKYYPFHDESKSNKYYARAIKDYKKSAESDGEASHQLGRMYQYGYGTDKDMDQAKFYYRQGALLGDINAAWRLGVIYKDEMEYENAYQFLLKAAEGGQGMAMYELAKLYENGLGTPINKEKAIEWYEKCAESSYVASGDAKKALERLGSSVKQE